MLGLVNVENSKLTVVFPEHNQRTHGTRQSEVILNKEKPTKSKLKTNFRKSFGRNRLSHGKHIKTKMMMIAHTTICQFIGGSEKENFENQGFNPFLWLRCLDDGICIWTDGTEKLFKSEFFLSNT